MAPIESPPAVVSLVAFAGRDVAETVVWLRGEHDTSTLESLSDTMARAIALLDADLVLDLSGVQFMGAETIGVIVRAHQFLRQRSRSLVVRSPSRCAQRVLDLCGLSELFAPTEQPVIPARRLSLVSSDSRAPSPTLTRH